MSVQSEKDEDEHFEPKMEVIKYVQFLKYVFSTSKLYRTISKLQGNKLVLLHIGIIVIEFSQSSLQLLQEAATTTEIPDVSFTEVVKLNSPEWKSITAASICSLISGFSMPILAIVLGDFVGVSLFLNILRRI